MDINRSNYESYFLLYLDNELNPAEKFAVDKFIRENTDLYNEFELLQQTVLIPQDLVFDHKELLLHKEEKRRVIPIYFLRIAAAVAVVIAGTWIIMNTIWSRKDLTINKKDLALNQGEKKNGEAAKNITENTIHANEMQVTDAENKKNSKQVIIRNPANQTQVVSAVNQSINPGTVESGSPELAENNSGTVESGTPETNHQQQMAAANPTLEKDEPQMVVHKSAMNPESVQLMSGTDLKPISAPSALPATVLLMSSNNSIHKTNNENEHLNDPELQQENAISVVALNEKNKSIPGFFKKLINRTPAEAEAASNTRKVRVSVFQFSF